jgi:hypothetical protein
MSSSQELPPGLIAELMAVPPPNGKKLAYGTAGETWERITCIDGLKKEYLPFYKVV